MVNVYISLLNPHTRFPRGLTTSCSIEAVSMNNVNQYDNLIINNGYNKIPNNLKHPYLKAHLNSSLLAIFLKLTKDRPGRASRDGGGGGGAATE